jgi:Fungal specific transcription factor domain
LPEEEECTRLFAVYKNVSQMVFPGVANLDKLEQELFQFHLCRSQETRETGIDEQTIYGKSLTWIALLFSILASGSHFSDFYDKRTRSLTSKAFICCSFECLRITNFLSHPNLETLQAMLVFINVLLNMYNAGVSWAMLGLLIRLAQSQGLHKDSRSSSSSEMQNERAKIWWAILWQDSLISIIYDRGGCVIDVSSSIGIPQEFDVEQGQWKFERCMYEVCRIGLEVVRERDLRSNLHETQIRMDEHEREILRLENAAAPWMRDLQYCTSFKERQQSLIFNIHKFYLMSEIFRPALNPNAHKTDRSRRMRQVCIDSLVSVVRAWSELLQIGGYPHRSWPAMHRTLSSALLLGILKEHEHDPKVLSLLKEFLQGLEDSVGGIDEQDIPDPLKRSMRWIRKLTVAKSSSSNSSGSPSMLFGDLDFDGSPTALLNQIMFPTGLTP